MSKVNFTPLSLEAIIGLGRKASVLKHNECCNVLIEAFVQTYGVDVESLSGIIDLEMKSHGTELFQTEIRELNNAKKALDNYKAIEA